MSITQTWSYNIDGRIPLHWCLSNNVGDALNYWLVKKISKREPYWVPLDAPINKFICIGSILNWANETCCVWGAGLANQTDTVNPKARILGVRGPVSYKIAHEHLSFVHNWQPVSQADPGLLVSSYYKPKMGCRSIKVGLIPHYADYHVLQEYTSNNGEKTENYFGDFKIINVFNPIEEIADQISKCQVILSSSLHGLVLADSYGVPNMHVKISDNVLGDGTKFYDYFLSVKRQYRLPIHFSRVVKYPTDRTVSLVKSEYSSIALDDYKEQLMETCPFT